MIRVREVKIPIDDDFNINILDVISKKLDISKREIVKYNINKKSLDARKKPNLFYVYEVDLFLKNEELIKRKNLKNVLFLKEKKYIKRNSGTDKLNYRPIIVGSGPAGLFCGYFLAEVGYKPLIIERGEDIDNRIESVNKFFLDGELNTNSNIQFGEGGAGTFSDGKLNTMIKDKEGLAKRIFQIFVDAGAPKEILYDSKPHIGTDVLRKVIKNIRLKIIKMGGEFRFNTILTDLVVTNNRITQIEVNNTELINTDILILALGHSARDTFKMLYRNNLNIVNKPFAVGVRIEHPREMIDLEQYGEKNVKKLGAASYKLTYKARNGRGVYTFCMCPGGYVINSSSEKDMLVVNGMSNYKRNSLNSNSAVIVTIDEKDYGNSPLAGISFQQNLEKKAFYEGEGKIPISLYKDFKNNKVSTCFGKVKPIFKSKYKFANLNNILPSEISSSLIEAIDYFDTKIKGFNRDDAIISAVESRTSSPIRMVRNAFYESNIKGIYPCGEGAGYAGGITSSAIDGVKIANSVIDKYSKKFL